jgi:prepilin-type N-terminal cleavage/methylation domain-containing protein
MRKSDGNSGFTIVELLMVIVIIAILAVIVIVGYGNVTKQAYYNRSRSELSSLAQAIQFFQTDNGRYPADVARGIPAEITPYIRGTSSGDWPTAPWPDSVYDYDYFTGSDGKDVVQVSVRFCPAGGPLSACHFPNESWAASFDVDSSAYWCVSGKCRAHPTQPDTYPGYCLNCNQS